MEKKPQIEPAKIRAKKRNEMFEYMRKLRANAGIPQSEVAARLGIRQEAIAQWEREQGNPPGIAMIPRLAKIYGVPEEEIMNQRNACGQRQRAARLPELDFDQGVRAGIFGYPLPCLDTVNDTDFVGQILDAIHQPKVEWRVVTLPCDTRGFFLKNTSDVMEPMIYKDAWVAFDPMIKPKHEHIVLVRREIAEGKTELLIRQYREEGGKRVLMAAKPERWPSDEIRETDKILAVAIEAHTILPR